MEIKFLYMKILSQIVKQTTHPNHPKNQKRSATLTLFLI